MLRQCSRLDEFAVGEFETPTAVAMTDGVGARQVWARLVAGPGWWSVDFVAHGVQMFGESPGYVGPAVDVFGVGWCAGFGVEPPEAAAFVGSGPFDAGGVLPGLVADHAVVAWAGGCEVVDVGGTTFGPVLVGVMEFDLGGGLIAPGSRAHLTVGAREGDETLFAGGQTLTPTEVQRHRGVVLEDRQPRLHVAGHREQVGDGQQGSGGGGGESGFADQVVQVGV